jgi:HAD superfamily hydrolase (TIGR01509 family)
MASVDAVLFDWRGTLVLDPPETWWIERAFKLMGRSHTSKDIERLANAVAEAKDHPDFVTGQEREDCDPVFHRELNIAMLTRAGLDDELAQVLYELDFDAESHSFYPDVPEAIRKLKQAGVAIAVVSNIHFDFRPEFAAEGLSECVDEFVLSFEHGIQKPDPRMFELALDRLDVEPANALMVGDWAASDSGATALGIATLILPRLRKLEPRRLDIVIRAANIAT